VVTRQVAERHGMKLQEAAWHIGPLRQLLARMLAATLLGLGSRSLCSFLRYFSILTLLPTFVVRR